MWSGAACWGWGPAYWFGGLGGAFVLLLFLALVILGASYVARLMAQRTAGKDGSRRETPIQIIERRYAAGEIGAEEFKRMRAELS